VSFVLFIICLYICVCECLLQNNNYKTKYQNNTTSRQYPYVRGPLRECRSIWSGASGLPSYCAPLVCVSDVMESLTVWRHNKPKTKKSACNNLRASCVDSKQKKQRSRKRAQPEGGELPKSIISFHNRDVHCLEDTRVVSCLSSGGKPFLRRYVSW